MTRNGVPIRDAYLSGKINVGIMHSMSFSVWDSAVRCGATLDELQKLEEGHYSRAFLAKVVAYTNLRDLIDSHIEEARAKAVKKRK